MQIYPFDPDNPECQLCGERLLEDSGEFWVPDLGKSIIADEICGRDNGLEMA